MKNVTRATNGNYNNYVGFLRSPNIRFDYHEERDPKRKTEILDAGKRIGDSIAYAWDYLFRLLRGMSTAASQSGQSGKELVGVYT